jgi:hypothetical protein
MYQQALEQVAGGKLSPSIFQDYFPSFAQSRGGEYSTRLAEIGAKFLSELVQLGSSIAVQPPSSNGDESAGPEVIPPRFDPGNPTRWFEQLAEYAGALNGRALNTYRAQLDRVASGQTTPSEVQQSTSEYLSRQLPDYLGRLTKACFEFLNGLNDVRGRYESDYFNGVLGSAKPNGEPRITLNLSGLPGTTASASLSIANTTAQRSVVDYATTDLRRIDGQGPAVHPALTITPEHLSLEPDEEADVILSLNLDPDRYDPGAVYAGIVYISGGSDFRVEVQLRVTVLLPKGPVEPIHSAGA